MFSERTSVGLDVHARSVVAHGIDWQTGQVFRDRLVPGPKQVLDWLHGLPGPVAVAYEAGPTGFGLARALTGAGVRCVVVAPSMLQRPPGDRVKTDARDALRLARLLHIGQVPEVRVPGEAEEAARDLVRAREDARADLMRARHRLSKLLLRHGICYSDGRAWTQVHEQWLRAQRAALAQAAARVAFDEAFEAVLATTARRDRLDAAIAQAACDPSWAPMVQRLACLRGIGTLTAFALTVEIGDWSRLTGSTIGAYLGLVPTENSSGTHRRQGSITKTGNTHARRLLIEAAWHYRQPRAAPSKPLRERRAIAAPAIRARAQAADRRLHHRWTTMDTRGKPATTTVVAVARELAGWCWSLAVMNP